MLVLTGGTIVDPRAAWTGVGDIVIEGETVQAVGRVTWPENAARIAIDGLLVTPGLIDVHVHLREPGEEHKETIRTGLMAAAAGGFSAVACMANTRPANDSGAITRFIAERARAAHSARLYPIGAISIGLRGERLAPFEEMREAGIVAVSDDGCPVVSADLMEQALAQSARVGLPVVVHEEDPVLAAAGVMNAGATAASLGFPGMSPAAEEAMLERDLALLRKKGGRLHIAHVSTAGSVALIKRAKAEGLPVTAEVTPHHFTLTEQVVSVYGTNAKMKPPLRTAADVAAVIEGLRDGVIDAIATDHAPHGSEDKTVAFERAANGIVGLETALPLALRLTDQARVPLETIIRAMSIAPARILGVPCGSLAPGGLADITVIDPKRRWTVDPALFHSKSRNTPFGGWAMEGGAVVTIVGGRVIWQAEDRSGPVAKRPVAKR